MGRVLMTELLQIVGRQTGHFHHRRRINIPFEHGLRDAKKRGAFALFMPFCIPSSSYFSARVINTVICCLSIHQAWRAEASRAPTSINSEPKILFSAFICFGPLIHAAIRCASVA